MSQRLDMFGEWRVTCGENISYGCDKATEICIQLIVDDGVPSRGHRTNFFKSEFKVMGSFSGPHKSYGNMTTLDYAGGYITREVNMPKP